MRYDTIIVLGRGIYEDGTVPGSAIKSVEKAKELLVDKCVAPRVIFCGKWSRHFNYIPPTTEAKAMKNLAIQIGVPDASILTEEESLDTVSNFYYAKKKYLEVNGWKRILLITLHKNDERALITARQMLGGGYQIDPFSIDYEFPVDTSEYILGTEKKKVRILKDFLREQDIDPGDHEKFFEAHSKYIQTHDIPPTFKQD